MQQALVITSVMPLVNFNVLVGATVQAAPMDDPVFKHETYIGAIEQVKINRMGTFVQFKATALVGMKWIGISKVIGFAHVADTQKAAS